MESNKSKENLFISKLEEIYYKLNLKLIMEISNNHFIKKRIFDKEIFENN